MAQSGFLRWRSWGTGERRALLLHGSTSSSATWWRVGPALAEHGWRVKAPDLPSHGASPRANARLTPQLAAGWVANELSDRPFDLVIGHAFGAAVALCLPDRHFSATLVLEEPPGPASIDWEAEAAALTWRIGHARRDHAGALDALQHSRPRWSAVDCEHAVRDLASCAALDVADGVRAARNWPVLSAAHPHVRVLVLAAPDAAGTSRARDETVLRGADREQVRERADAFNELPGGHCLHRDAPDRWVQSVLDFANRDVAHQPAS